MPNIIDKLVDQNKIPSAKLLVEDSLDLKICLIKLLCTNEHAKDAASLIKEYRLDINDYPEVQERLMKASMRYYLGRNLTKKKDDSEYMSLDKIEDLF